MVLESIYEQDFYPCSYGFRPGRSAHQALQALRTGFMTQGLRWVLDVDIHLFSVDAQPSDGIRAKSFTERVMIQPFLDRRRLD